MRDKGATRGGLGGALVRVAWCVALWSVAASPGVASGLATTAQPENPVYTDDSTSASATLAGVGALVESGNLAEAVRAVQRLLDTEPDRVIQASGDANLFESVRARVHRDVLGNARLLAAYREAQEPAARAALEAGEEARAEASFLLTKSGFEATLRVAQEQLERAWIEAARQSLEQLEAHPDRRSDAASGAAAAELLTQVAGYLDRAEVWDRAAAWRAEAGMPPIDRARTFEAPEVVRRRVSSVMTAGDSVRLTELPSRPLWSVPISGLPESGSVPGVSAGPEYAGLWVVPSVAGDVVFVNDAIRVQALDRYTLEPRWSVTPGSAGVGDDELDEARVARSAPYASRQVEDTASVALAGPVVLAVTGFPTEGRRDGDPRLHALDHATGRVLWSVDPPALDPRLEGTAIRGPVVTDGHVAVVSLRRAVPTQRMFSQYLVGVEISSGRLLWVRHLGSAGAIAFQRVRRVADTPVVHQGVVYTSDQMGLYAGVVTATGRPAWVRRYSTIDSLSSSPWESCAPVVDGDRVVLLTPERREILVLNRFDGRVLATRSAAHMDQPRYLVRVGGAIAGVGYDKVSFLDLADIPNGRVRQSDRFNDQPIRGRVVAAGADALVPVSTGYLLLDPASPKLNSVRVRLESPGLATPIGDQVVVADDRSVHSYLSWGVAERLLAQRMEAAPDDPRPAVSAADLAYRGGRPEAIVPCADAALRALSRTPGHPESESARRRLFENLREVVSVALAGEGAAPDEMGWTPPSLTPPVLDGVVERLGLAAKEPSERVSALMLRAQTRERHGDPAGAVAAYQGVLADDALAASRWESGGVVSRADLESSRQLRELVRARGAGIYARFEEEMAGKARGLGASADAAAVERLAREYPVARSAWELWVRAADLHESAGRPSAALVALSSALACAEGANPSGIGESGGRLISALAAADRLSSASSTLARLMTRYPGLVLTVRGVSIDAEARAAELGEALARSGRLPRIGSTLQADPQVLAGWVLMRPLSVERSPRASEHIVLLSMGEGEVALWGVDPTGDDARTGALSKLWSRSFQERPPVLLRHDPDAVYLFWGGPTGATVERVDSVTGQTRWRTPAFAGSFPVDPAFEQRLVTDAGAPVRFETPLDGPARLTDMLAVMDGSTLALIERSGRVMTFDLRTGERRGTFISPVGTVFDAEVSGDTVIVSGAADPPERDTGEVPDKPMVAIHALDGAQRARVDGLDSEVRWVRLTPGGLAVIGTRTALLGVDASRGGKRWEIIDAATFESRDAWVLGDVLLLMSDDRSLYRVALTDGTLGEKPLDTRDRLDGLTRTEAMLIDGSIAVATGRGLLAYSIDGELSAMDGLNATDAILQSAPSRGYFVTCEVSPRQLRDGRLVYPLHLLSFPGLSVERTHTLALGDQPDAVAVLDGRVLVTAGGVTVVYQAPVGSP